MRFIAISRRSIENGARDLAAFYLCSNVFLESCQHRIPISSFASPIYQKKKSHLLWQEMPPPRDVYQSQKVVCAATKSELQKGVFSVKLTANNTLTLGW